jgi:hypothetical protein
MRKTLSVALAALTLAGGALSAGAADARDYRHYNGGHYYNRGHNNDGAAIVAGIAGLAIGAAIAGGGHDRYRDNGYRGGGYYRPGYYDRSYYDRGYYDRGYYDREYYDRDDYAGPSYAYGYAPRRCRTFTQWDPYADAYIRRTNCW